MAKDIKAVRTLADRISVHLCERADSSEVSHAPVD